MVSLGQSAPYNSPLYCRKINLPPGFIFVEFFCFVFLFWQTVTEPADPSLYLSLVSSKESPIRRHCTIPLFFLFIFIVLCTNDAHHAKGHDLYKDFCRGASLPHHGFKSQEIFWGVRWDWRSGGHYRQTDRQVSGLWIRKYHSYAAEHLTLHFLRT